MKYSEQTTCFLILGFLNAMMVVIVFVQIAELKKVRQEAINLGYAEHNRTNGVWQFIKK